MSAFHPGDKVIKRGEKDARNHGTVMDIPATQQRSGYVAVLFQRHVWIKPENLLHFDEWRQQKPSSKVKTGQSIKDYWMK